ncbi:polysaccharide lyase family 8 protein [Crepidotus variabilis]|uniref:Polysaccharide lyase family 8 protein n=1 Tax=Crepidotus variabilis TaxID=179855 RepID=A0A9P6ELH3_9AGAR|nr:polysaccharide lyase family 8 protein [Crepidotus variabilis]
MQLRIALAASAILLGHHRNVLFTQCNGDTSGYPVSTSRLSFSPTDATPVMIQSTNITTSQLQDIWILQQRRVDNILGATQSPAQIPTWLRTLGFDGKWPDSEVDYTTGCSARRANWPAQVHWQRLADMARAWRGLPGEDQFKHNSTLRMAISSGMGYWFGRDFHNLACLDSGGTPSCPCNNLDNTFWNTNWFSNLILIPEFVSQTCLLLNETLSDSEFNNCTRITRRSYGAFGRTINGLGILTGANTLDVVKVGIDQGLLTLNASLLEDSFGKAHSELQIQNDTHGDGIRPDGSFGQHNGLMYNGNYGKDFTNDFLGLEIEAAGTGYTASASSRQAFATLFEGDRWMIYRNTVTGTLHWDFSALPRFISFPAIDGQATANIKLNLSEILELGKLWSSDTLTNFATTLDHVDTTANAGNLLGNRMFYTNDYMVHRGSNYVTTLKMFSSRTKNTECTNSQNPFGFHLADGTLYTHVQGDEYEDISAAWDWDHIPGITVDYGATELSCDTARHVGIEPFVGGVSDGQIGLSAMRYTNPLTKSLGWQKAWFFLNNDTQLVMVSALDSNTNANVISVLDQRRSGGTIMVDGAAIDEADKAQNVTNARTLWHGGVGYVLPTAEGSAFNLGMDVGEKMGNWSDIGTSTQPASTVNLFAAWIVHPARSLSTPLSYIIYPGTTPSEFVQKSHERDIQIIQNDEQISAVYDVEYDTVLAIFWDLSGGTLAVRPGSGKADILVESSDNLALIYKQRTGEVIVSDLSQTLKSVNVTISVGHGTPPPPLSWVKQPTQKLIFDFPSGGLTGSSMSQIIP